MFLCECHVVVINARARSKPSQDAPTDNAISDSKELR
jgi:hypothetical protein